MLTENSFFLWGLGIILSPFLIFVLIYCINAKLTSSRKYNVIDTYLIKKDTPLTYISFRHAKIYITIVGGNTFSIQKVVNLYTASNGQFLEVISDTLINKELTVADKDIFVVKIKDDNENTKLISYALKYLTPDQCDMIQNLKCGEYVSLGSLTDDLLIADVKQSAILINNFL